MINLSFNNMTNTTNTTTKQISENILKISEYLKFQYDNREYNEESLPILNYDSETFEIFEKWFTILDDILTNVKECSINTLLNKLLDENNEIFKPEFFNNYSMQQKLKLFNFGLGNQFEILCKTIAYNLKNEKIVDTFICGDFNVETEQFETLKINYVLKQLIEKYKISDYCFDNNYLVLYSDYVCDDNVGEYVGKNTDEYVGENKKLTSTIFTKAYTIWKIFGINILLHGFDNEADYTSFDAEDRFLELGKNKNDSNYLNVYSEGNTRGEDLSFGYRFEEKNNKLLFEYQNFDDDITEGTFEIENTFKNFIEVLTCFEINELNCFINEYIEFINEMFDLKNRVIKDFEIPRFLTKSRYLFITNYNDVYFKDIGRNKQLLKELFEKINITLTDENFEQNNLEIPDRDKLLNDFYILRNKLHLSKEISTIIQEIEKEFRILERLYHSPLNKSKQYNKPRLFMIYYKIQYVLSILGKEQ